MSERTLRPNRSGFTIVELIVVMVILAVMTSLAVPAFRSWVDEDDLTFATRRVETLFRMARDSAVRAGLPMTVWIDSITGRAWLVPVTLDSASIAPPVTRPGVAGRAVLDAGEEIGLPPSVHLQLSRARASFRFGPGGAVFADTLILSTVTGNRRITLNPWTGDVVY
jgi:prepilin-type N-terminal cleavage/methylation domain-containing protein